MKRLLLSFVMLFVALFVCAQQVLTYVSEDNHTVKVSATSTCTYFQIDNQQPFALQVTGVSNGMFLYATPAGGIAISSDMQTLMITTYNPSGTMVFTLQESSLSGYQGETVNSYSGYGYGSQSNNYSGRSRAQIEYDINKTERYMNDAISNRENTSSYSLKVQYNSIISNYESRLEELYRELANAPY